MGMNVVVIGGVACGPKAAARLRRLDPKAQITIVEQGEFISYAGCGLPYYVGGEVKDINGLLATPAGAVRNAGFFKKVKDIAVLTRTRAEAIDRSSKTVRLRDLASGAERRLAYDKLVIATGARPIRPPIEGLGLKGVYHLTRIEEALALRETVSRRKGGKALIIGAGLIGLESAEAFRSAGWDVQMVEMMEAPLLGLLDFEFARMVELALLENLVTIACHQRAERIEGDESGHCKRVITGGGACEADLVLVATGFRPNADLAREAGLAVGPCGGIAVDEAMRTSDPNILAGGDCVECRHVVTGKPVFAPMGSTANKHGRVIGDNLAGGHSAFPGVLGTTVVKVFNLNVGRTGLSEAQAAEEGFETVCGLAPGHDKAHYFPGAALVAVKVVAEKRTGKVLGVQAAGRGEAARRIDVGATAIAMGATVAQLANLDLGYAPPYAQAMDAIITAANVAENKIRGVARSVGPREVKRRIEAGEDFILLDVRTPAEFESGHIEAKQTMNLPLGELREKAQSVLPKDKDIVSLCKVSHRGYEAQRILAGMGYEKASYMDGGLFTWPYPEDIA